MKNRDIIWTEEEVAARCNATDKVASSSSLDALLSRLKSDPDTPPRDALKQHILKEVTHPSPAPATWVSAARVAALIIVSAIAFTLFHHLTRPIDAKSQALDRSIQWLIDQQHPDGGWRPSTWGGNDQFTAGVTALSLLALLQSEATEVTTARTKAKDFLTAQLTGASPDRTQAFSYNHSLAALALLESYAKDPDDKTKAVIDGAVRDIIRQQSTSGGWGYQVSTGLEYGGTSPANSAISVWPLAVLKRASEQGWTEAKPMVRKATKWMGELIDEYGLLGYRSPGDFPHGPDTLLVMGLSTLSLNDHPLREVSKPNKNTTSDMYHAFFTAQALHKQASQELHALQDHIIATQIKDGSWETRGKWSKAGGRVYATAMASMSLNF